MGVGLLLKIDKSGIIAAHRDRTAGKLDYGVCRIAQAEHFIVDRIMGYIADISFFLFAKPEKVCALLKASMSNSQKQIILSAT